MLARVGVGLQHWFWVHYWRIGYGSIPPFSFVWQTMFKDGTLEHGMFGMRPRRGEEAEGLEMVVGSG